MPVESVSWEAIPQALGDVIQKLDITARGPEGMLPAWQVRQAAVQALAALGPEEQPSIAREVAGLL